MGSKEILAITESKSLLFVEDDDKLRETMTDLLKDLFAEVTIAKDGQEGLERVKEKEFDYVISDINMPKMDGVELLQSIRELYPKMKVIFLTAHSDMKYILAASQYRVSGYINKPITLDALEEVLLKIEHKK